MNDSYAVTVNDNEYIVNVKEDTEGEYKVTKFTVNINGEEKTLNVKVTSELNSALVADFSDAVMAELESVIIEEMKAEIQFYLDSMDKP